MKNLLVVFLLCLSSSLFSQLTMRVENLEIGNIKYPVNWEEIFDDGENGPYLEASCIIENNTDTVVSLYLIGEKLATLYYIFNYEGKQYKESISGMLAFFSKVIIGSDTLQGTPSLIKIQPFNCIKLRGVSYIFEPGLLFPVEEGTKFLDYTDRLLEILPTLEIEYEDENLTIKASGIEHVTLNRDTYTP